MGLSLSSISAAGDGQLRTGWPHVPAKQTRTIVVLIAYHNVSVILSTYIPKRADPQAKIAIKKSTTRH